MTNKELKERVNHIERELQQIKQQVQTNKKITFQWEDDKPIEIAKVIGDSRWKD